MDSWELTSKLSLSFSLSLSLCLSLSLSPSLTKTLRMQERVRATMSELSSSPFPSLSLRAVALHSKSRRLFILFLSIICQQGSSVKPRPALGRSEFSTCPSTRFRRVGFPDSLSDSGQVFLLAESQQASCKKAFRICSMSFRKPDEKESLIRGCCVADD